MSKRQKLAFGVVLVLVGTALFARPYFPVLEPFFGWPLLLIPLGLLGIVTTAVLQEGGWLIASAFVTGIGVNRWAARSLDSGSWVIPVAFLGLGFILAALFDPTEKDAWRPGLIFVAVSGLLFLIVGGWKFLPWPRLSGFLPLVIVLIGVIFILAGIAGKKKTS
ncbi:MAG: hypothetical protein GX415_03185 [Chloroflexi bacterium]|jgi:hypothetical protein|nr:hypothetical protein [Anaerolineaceae bacterium]NLI44403.1 hypothetical protein [Chloroflexota bacterium]HOE34440.1 hypothetical protein [Anaerolineaceae bacterium]HOT25450.1 hypothetical protein [Anaerolineaceae bacterium]HQH57436.1 hypothetical protein [Anaerolineaceae bacterium]